jgi:hypothetical protein
LGRAQLFQAYKLISNFALEDAVLR